MVATYLWFDYLGRRVTREEFEGIVRLQTHDTNYKANHGLLDRLEKPSDELTIAYENAGNKLKDIWIPRVGRRFAQLRQEDRVAKERAQDLVGL